MSKAIYSLILPMKPTLTVWFTDSDLRHVLKNCRHLKKIDLTNCSTLTEGLFQVPQDIKVFCNEVTHVNIENWVKKMLTYMLEVAVYKVAL